MPADDAETIAAIRDTESELSPSLPVVAASTQKGEEHEDDDEHPQQRTHGNASNQRQDDEDDNQKDNQIHVSDATPESRRGHP